MDVKKKVFKKPVAEVIDFENDDIITLSTGTGQEIGEGDNVEDFTPPIPLS